ncbi:MAG TPA: type I DNA topoisomerase [Candidatus Babeliales bacterium]|nr:type I DNA topoisomerase [Candidatus Babeliales bacterium]
MKKLVIVESPAKIKTISKILGKDFKIMSTMGHVMDLPAKKIGVSIEKDSINIKYVPIKDKDRVIAEICKAAQGADAIFLGPDPDREGEIIAWHIENQIKKASKKTGKIYRIVFNEITAPAINEAIENPGSIDLDKVGAQQARRILDRWVGYEVSPVLWKQIAPGLSAGRVQSVSLRLIVDREEAIRAFKPEEYWTIDGLFKQKKDPFVAALTHIGKKKLDAKDKKTADKIVDDVKKQSYEVESIDDKTRLKNPLPPFMTSSLQQAAYNRLGFSVKKTMQVAQKLYEGVPLDDPSTPVALITYMRTDSLRLSDTALKSARAYISATYSKEYLPTKVNVYDKKSKSKAQDAHEAVRPVNANLSPESIKRKLSPDQAKLYTLIWQRFIACQMKPAQYAQRVVTIKGGSYSFKATGSTLIFDGFLKVYGVEDEDKDKVKIPADLQPKQSITLTTVDPKQHFTQPPPRYTEASLVKEMEKEGIGRPSTYATILSTIQARDYTKLDEKKRFIPTELGIAVTHLLIKNLPHIMDTKFTANMEEDLDKVAQGELDRDKLLRSFYKEFQEDLKKFKGTTGKASQKAAIPTELTCPTCKKHKLNIRFGRSGEFLGCPGFPDCDFTSNFERTEAGEIKIVKAEPPKLLDEKCPKCGQPLRKLNGRFGEFIACSGYPKCKYIQQETASFTCPQDKGDVVRRVWRGGKFWGCSNYPKCKFAIFDEIEEKKCPKCKLPFLIKKTSKEGKVTLLCSNKECGYTNEK